MDLFEYLHLRQPTAPRSQLLRPPADLLSFVWDGVPYPTRVGTIAGLRRTAIGAAVVNHVLCIGTDPNIEEHRAALLAEILDGLPTLDICNDADGRYWLDPARARCIADQAGRWHVLPEQPADLRLQTWGVLPQCIQRLREALDTTITIDVADDATEAEVAEATAAANAAAIAALVADFERYLGRPLFEYLFGDQTNAPQANQDRSVLFEAYATLLVLHHWQPTNPARIVELLQLLHLMYILALDTMYRAVRAGSAPSLWGRILSQEPVSGSALARWDQASDLAGWPAAQTIDDLRSVFATPPAIHPVVLQLWRYLMPMPSLRPIGIGDLNIVRSELIGYEATDLADIENTAMGHTVRLTMRDLERSEDLFGQDVTTTEGTETSSEESTRFAVKTEAENVTKSALAANAAVSVTYDQKPVTVTTSGSLNYSTDNSSTARSASEYARDVVAKAVSRVERTVATHRRLTRTIEHERTELKERTSSTAHTSAIYAWVNRRYRGQVYNYGKRLLLETLVREPAIGLVDDLLHVHDVGVRLPDPPGPPALEPADLDFVATDIRNRCSNA